MLGDTTRVGDCERIINENDVLTQPARSTRICYNPIQRGGHFRFLSIASNNLTILANIIYGETSGSRMETE